MRKIPPFAPIVDFVKDCVHQFTFWPLPVTHILKKWRNRLPLVVCQIGWIGSTLLAHDTVNATIIPYENRFLALTLTGTVDRIRETEEGLGICDLKTGKSAVAADGTVKTQGHALQIGVYELLAQAAIGRQMSAPAQIIGLQTAKTDKGRRVATGEIDCARELLLDDDDGSPGYLRMAAKIIHSGDFLATLAHPSAVKNTAHLIKPVNGENNICKTTLAALKSDICSPQNNIAMNMETVIGFESMQRIASLFAKSDITPKAYQGNLSNCFIAVDMAMRMGANPLMVMQNLYIVHGTPAWSAQFLIATFNKSDRFSSLRYEFVGKEGEDSWGCRAVTTELSTKEKFTGPLITIGMAKKEGWYTKSGSKWQTMPEQMLRYRAAAWLVRAYAPEIAMGLHTAEEVQDKTITVEAISVEKDNNATNMEQIANETKELKSKKKQAKPALEDNQELEVEPVIENNPEIAEEPDSKNPHKKNTSAKLSPSDILCSKTNPDGSPRLVEQIDCNSCPDRKGCPNQ